MQHKSQQTEECAMVCRYQWVLELASWYQAVRSESSGVDMEEYKLYNVEQGQLSSIA